MTIRKKHTAQFKSQVAIAAIQGRKTAAEIASEYGVHPAMVSQWKKAAIEMLESGFAGPRENKSREPLEFSRDNLLGQIGQLKVELDWLKKSVRVCQ
jgi:putative transposase